METRLIRAALTTVTLLVSSIAGRPLVAQGIGAIAGLGVYRSFDKYPGYQDPGIGGEAMGQWRFQSGLVLGIGGRAISYQNGPRLSVFLDARYAPAPTATHRVQPIIGVRAGPYLDEISGDPLMGLEAGSALGVSLRLARGISLTLAGDLTLVLTSNYSFPDLKRGFSPGLVLGLTFH